MLALKPPETEGTYCVHGVYLILNFAKKKTNRNHLKGHTLKSTICSMFTVPIHEYISQAFTQYGQQTVQI